MPNKIKKISLTIRVNSSLNENNYKLWMRFNLANQNWWESKILTERNRIGFYACPVNELREVSLIEITGRKSCGTQVPHRQSSHPWEIKESSRIVKLRFDQNFHRRLLSISQIVNYCDVLTLWDQPLVKCDPLTIKPYLPNCFQIF